MDATRLRRWEIPQNIGRQALEFWVADVRTVVAARADPEDAGALLGILGIREDGIAYRGESSYNDRLGVLIDACLWRLWHWCKAATIEAGDDPSASVFAPSMALGGELADELFPSPLH